MANPLTTELTPDFTKKSVPICVGLGTFTGGAGAVVVTIDPKYPAINRRIQSPILGIFKFAVTAATMANADYFTPDGQMPIGTAADSANEFDITGARTIRIYDGQSKNGFCMVVYVPEGQSYTV